MHKSIESLVHLYTCKEGIDAINGAINTARW